MQRERGEENAQPFFTSLFIYTYVTIKGSQSSFGKLIISDFYFNREFLGVGFLFNRHHQHTAAMKYCEKLALLRNYLAGLAFENNEHFFDGELSAASHAVVADFMVKKDSTGWAIWAIYALVFRLKHFSMPVFLSQKYLLYFPRYLSAVSEQNVE